jgi:hypothetical protein
MDRNYILSDIHIRLKAFEALQINSTVSLELSVIPDDTTNTGVTSWQNKALELYS